MAVPQTGPPTSNWTITVEKRASQLQTGPPCFKKDLQHFKKDNQNEHMGENFSPLTCPCLSTTKKPMIGAAPPSLLAAE
jgi:hypothetical protein